MSRNLYCHLPSTMATVVSTCPQALFHMGVSDHMRSSCLHMEHFACWVISPAPLCVKTGSCSGQTGHEFTILLPQPLEYWVYSCVSHYPPRSVNVWIDYFEIIFIVFPFSSQEWSVLVSLGPVIIAHFLCSNIMHHLSLPLWMVDVLSFVEEEAEAGGVQQLAKWSKWSSRRRFCLSFSAQDRGLTTWQIQQCLSPLYSELWVLKLLVCPCQLGGNFGKDTSFWGRGEASLSPSMLHPGLCDWQIKCIFMVGRWLMFKTLYLWRCTSMGSGSFDLCQHSLRTSSEEGSPGTIHAPQLKHWFFRGEEMWFPQMQRTR